MNKLYSLAFKRILTSLAAQEIKPTNVQEILARNNVKAVGSFVLHRLPRNQLQNFVKRPCPVSNVQSEQSKQIIKSSKSLRASFSINEEKVCDKCPFKQNCLSYAKPGIENNANVMVDLLVYMQAMNNKTQLDDTNQMKIWSSGYKSSDNILEMLNDLKQGGTETLEYQRIRLQNISEREAAQQKFKDLGKMDFSNPPKVVRKQKKIKTKIEDDQEDDDEFVKEVSNLSKRQQEKLKQKHYQLFEEQEEDETRNFKNKQPKRSREKPYQYKRQSISPKEARQKNKSAQKYERSDRRQRYIKDQPEFQQDSEPYQRRERRKEKMHNFETKNQNKNENIRNKREKYVEFDGKERTYTKPQETLKKYKNTVQRETENSPFQQGRGSAKQRLRSKESFYDNGIDFDAKFDKLGNVYKNPQIFQPWSDESVLQQPKSPKPRKFSNPEPVQTKPTLSIKFQQSVQQRRGRKIRR